MTGIELVAENEEAEKVVAEILDRPKEPSPRFKRRGSQKRKKSLMLEIDGGRSSRETSPRSSPRSSPMPSPRFSPKVPKPKSQKEGSQKQNFIPDLPQIVTQNSVEGIEEPLRRQGSRKYGKKRGTKDQPYPTRKGSLRRFNRQGSITESNV